MADVLTTNNAEHRAHGQNHPRCTRSISSRPRRATAGCRQTSFGGAPPRSVVLRSHPPSSRRGQRCRTRGAGTRCSGHGRAARSSSRGPARLLRRRPVRQRTARRAAGPSGRDAPRRPARDLRRWLVADLAAARSKDRRPRQSSPQYLDRLGVALEPGWRGEINLRAVEWIRDAARRLARGFIIVIDYGHEARELYSVTHAGGTLTTFARHTHGRAERPADAPAWLEDAGRTGHHGPRRLHERAMAAEAEGLTTLGFLDQTYFLMGLGAARSSTRRIRNRAPRAEDAPDAGRPGQHAQVMIFAKDVGTPALAGCSVRVRLT